VLQYPAILEGIMAIACPVDLDTTVLRSEVSKIYSRVATDPNGDFHFHRGPVYAANFLGYDPAELAALPAECTASFAGIANPHAIAPILPGETVLDIGCGDDRCPQTGSASRADARPELLIRGRASVFGRSLTRSLVLT
jgi:hypothetical protein